MHDVLLLSLAILLVVLNGFFVAAEFAMVKLRPHRLDEMVREGRPFAKSGKWLMTRLDATLAACQLGITMASLGLGWVGEPAFARLLEPLLTSLGVESAAVLHTTSFIFAFGSITALHLVIGEQLPKIYAIRRPELLALWCAVPLRIFFVVAYPLFVALNAATAVLLRWLGVQSASEHDAPQTDEEVRAMLRLAHAHGTLTRSEHRLLHAVFEFDDMVCRRVMVPRNEVEFLDADLPIAKCLEIARGAKHTRYPVCDDSLDNVLGVVHVKDLIGVDEAEPTTLRSLARPPHYVPETMQISRLLRHFQATRQHLAFVVDEYGTVIGIVTMENVLEQIVGPVEDEFDSEEPQIVPDGPDEFLAVGGASIASINERLGVQLDGGEADTISGLVTARLGRLPATGDVVDLEGVTAHVLAVDGSRAVRIRITRPPGPDDAEIPRADG